jgi:phosphatidylserine/phosphatidylglycerophosphate/cardiolipin synthase-like enzyme
MARRSKALAMAGADAGVVAHRSSKASAAVVAAKRVRKRARTHADKLVDIARELATPEARRPRRGKLTDIARELAESEPRPPRRGKLTDIARELAAPAHPSREASDAPLDIVAPARAISMQLVAGRGHYERVLQAVLGAKVSVWIATANVKELMVEDRRAKPGRRRSLKKSDYVSVLEQLDQLAARGVELRLLHAEIPSGPFRREIAQHPRLVAGDLALRRCPRVHLKAVIVDGELLYLGSANWTGAGLGAKGSGRRNFELGFVTDDAQLLDQIQAMYERIWSGGECGTCKLRHECPGPLVDL